MTKLQQSCSYCIGDFPQCYATVIATASATYTAVTATTTLPITNISVAVIAAATAEDRIHILLR